MLERLIERKELGREVRDARVYTTFVAVLPHLHQRSARRRIRFCNAKALLSHGKSGAGGNYLKIDLGYGTIKNQLAALSYFHHDALARCTASIYRPQSPIRKDGATWSRAELDLENLDLDGCHSPSDNVDHLPHPYVYHLGTYVGV